MFIYIRHLSILQTHGTKSRSIHLSGIDDATIKHTHKTFMVARMGQENGKNYLLVSACTTGLACSYTSLDVSSGRDLIVLKWLLSLAV